MIRTLVAGLPGHIGETVTIKGWVQTLRLQRMMQFVLIRDHSGTVQVTWKRDGGPIEAGLENLTPESAVVVTGQVLASPKVALGGLEIVPAQVSVVNQAATPLPIDDRTGPDLRQDWRLLDIRTRPQARLVFDVQTTAEGAMRDFAYAEGCTEMHTPKLMGTASESGSSVFRLDYFGRHAYLAQSPQFYKQMALAAGIDRVFEIGPVFRAEPSYTARHATEFTGVDAELAWIDGLDDVISFEERMLRHVLTAVADRHGEAISRLCGVEVAVPPVPFPRIAMSDAQRLLRASGWAGQRDDLDPDGERRLSTLIRERTGHEFVFVTHYPVSARPFYHMRDADAPELTLSFDLLWNGLEITTGAQREHRYDVLLAQAAEQGLSPEPMADYLNAFRYGCPPHGGFGLGLSRLLMTLLGLGSIRDAMFLFRGPTRLSP